jgi:hypothetical protein
VITFSFTVVEIFANMAALRYTSIQANYLTIPVYAVATIAVGVLSFLSDRLNTRVTLLVVVPIPVIIGYAIVIGTANIAAGYFAMFLVASGMFVDTLGRDFPL